MKLRLVRTDEPCGLDSDSLTSTYQNLFVSPVEWILYKNDEHVDEGLSWKYMGSRIGNALDPTIKKWDPYQ